MSVTLLARQVCRALPKRVPWVPCVVCSTAPVHTIPTATFTFETHMDTPVFSSSHVTSATPLLEEHPDNVAERMEAEGLHRGYLVWDHAAKTVQASHPMFQDTATLLQDMPDFDDHQAIFFEVGPVTDTLHLTTIHRTNRGAAAGGVRYWPYDTLAAVIRDSLRLSRGMTRKSALAGLWYGGGKGIIAKSPSHEFEDAEFRSTMFREYGAFVTSLRGCYITAEDAGTNTDDMKDIYSRTRFVITAPEEVGGSGNPSALTGHGVVSAMEAALVHTNLGNLSGKTVAVQGVGNVSIPMMQMLLERGVRKVLAVDINPDNVQRGLDLFRDEPVDIKHVTAANSHKILFEDVDIVAPCALGGILNKHTIPHIKAPIVCGAANNQLLSEEKDAKRLLDRGITYVPDYVANRMGIVNAANEHNGVMPSDLFVTRHLSRNYAAGIFMTVQNILTTARRDNITTHEAAAIHADIASREFNPLWPGRGRSIINSLIATDWASGKTPPSTVRER